MSVIIQILLGVVLSVLIPSVLMSVQMLISDLKHVISAMKINKNKENNK